MIAGAPVKEQLARIQERFGVQLVYDANIEKLLRKETTSQFREGKTLGQNLDAILDGTGIRYVVDGRYVILKAASPRTPRKQGISVSGYVKDRTSGETLIGAGIFNGTVGTVTNEYGFYSLNVPSGTNILHVSYVGYEDRTIELTSRRDTAINVSLSQNLRLEGARITSFQEVGLHSMQPGSMEISQQTIQSTPVVLGEADVLKTLQLMPGIQSGMEGFSGIYVRGGGPDENLIMLDGVPLYNVNHLFGLFSAFTPEAVKKVTLYTGSFPAKYGGRASSVIDVRTNDGNEKELRGSVSIGLLSDKFHLEGPLGDGRTTFSASARTMHTFLVSPVMAFCTDKLNYLFYDLNGKVSHRFSDKDRLSLSVYKGRDRFRYRDWDYSERIDHDNDTYRPSLVKETKEMDLRINYGNMVAALRHTHVFGSNLFSDYMVAWNSYGMEMLQKSGDRSFDFASGIRDITAKADFDWTLSSSNLLRFGCEYVFHRFRPERSVITTPGKTMNTIGSRRIDGNELAVHVSDNISFSEHLSADAGARLTLFNVQGKNNLTLQPRVSLQYMTGSDVSFKAAYSRMSQYVHLLSSGSMSLPTDLWVPVTKNTKPEVSDIGSFGTYYTGIKGWELSLEGYYKRLTHVIDYIDGKMVFQTNSSWEDNVTMGNGRSYGAEAYVRKTAGRTTGSFACTLSKSERIFPDGKINNGKWFPYQYDRRHNITLSLAHRVNDRIDISGLWTFSSGNWMTVPEKRTEIIFPSSAGADGFSHMELYHISSRNNYRLPSSHRLDVSANFRKQKKHGERVWTLGVYNLYNHRNPNWVVVDFDQAGTSSQYETYLSVRSFLTAMPFFSYTFNF